MGGDRLCVTGFVLPALSLALLLPALLLPAMWLLRVLLPAGPEGGRVPAEDPLD